jgi:hypothetical protein
MFCTPIKEKYKNSLVTFLIIIVSLIVLSFIVTSQSVLISLSSNYMIVALWITSFMITSYVFLYDPTMLCGTLQKNCRKSVAVMGTINVTLSVPFVYFLVKKIIGEDSPWRFVIPLTVWAIGITTSWIKYNVDPDSLIDDPINILKCHKTRLLFYMIILTLDLFNALQFYKQSLPPDQLAMSFNLPPGLGIVIFPIYIIYNMIYPVTNDILGLDGAVKYDIKEIKAT